MRDQAGIVYDYSEMSNCLKHILFYFLFFLFYIPDHAFLSINPMDIYILVHLIELLFAHCMLMDLDFEEKKPDKWDIYKTTQCL